MDHIMCMCMISLPLRLSHTHTQYILCLTLSERLVSPLSIVSLAMVSVLPSINHSLEAEDSPYISSEGQ